MDNSTKITFGAIVVGLVMVVGLVTFFKPDPEPISLPLVIEEYSDFQCPACQAYYLTVNELKETFEDEIDFTYKHFPLESIHPRAFPAAVAAEAAREQGKFEEYHDILFANQNNLSDEDFIAYAEELELDTDRFQSDYESNEELKNRVQADQEEGLSRGVNATPTFFVNGERLSVTGPDSLIRKISEMIEDAHTQDEIEQAE
ncbi:thioredoxin domain-containing protein [Candidatus Dojkabacteria bacterium]|uniref:Thioredoxin domain-containing protein n=1 Tax=Candidatus Dojkabacteria bacterium TaxID=2099670 RepID=A0A955L8L5_9BACT|nr:thioredoxin domain-containing protein [Candidatus Dojkabacteria bacterium]